MNQERQNEKLDKWLDQTLAEYRRVEPRPGIEARVLANLRSRLSQRSWWHSWQRVLWIYAVACLLMLVMVLLTGQREKTVIPDLAKRSDQELLLGIDRLLDKEVPAALEPALVLAQEMVKK